MAGLGFGGWRVLEFLVSVRGGAVGVVLIARGPRVGDLGLVGCPTVVGRAQEAAAGHNYRSRNAAEDGESAEHLAKLAAVLGLLDRFRLDAGFGRQFGRLALEG